MPEGDGRALTQSEQETDRGLAIGWITDAVDLPDEWGAEWRHGGTELDLHKKVDRSEYGLKPPGYPGLSISSGSDFWHVTGVTDHVVYQEFVMVEDGDEHRHADEFVEHVEVAVDTVADGLDRLRLKAVLGDCVPRSVFKNLIARFNSADRALEAMQNGESQALEATTGVGPKRRERLQRRARRYARTGTPECEVTRLE